MLNIKRLKRLVGFDYKYDFITIGGATEDITFFTNQARIITQKGSEDLIAFKYGTKIKIDESFSSFGGGAANTGVNLANLRFKTAVKIFLGDDVRGEGILRNFEKRKIDTSLIKIIKNYKSGFSFLVVAEENEHVLFASRAVNNKLKISKKDLKIFETSKWLFISSLSGDWKDTLKNIFSVKNPNIAWNPGYEQLSHPAHIKKYFKKTNVLLLNKEEAKRLVASHSKYKNKDNTFLNKSENLLKILIEWGVQMAVVTNGKHGTHVYDGNMFYHARGNKVRKVADTTGVGDCFGSTFVAALELTDNDIKKSLRIASKNVASVLTEVGAQNGLLKRKDLI